MKESEIITENTDMVQDTGAAKIKKPKNKHRALKGLAIVLVIIAIIALGLGFLFPGLLWTKDLGVSYTKQDYDSFINKLDYVKDSTPTGNLRDTYIYSYGDVAAVDTQFTSAELTAFANYNRPSYFAVKNVQIRINKDRTVDASGSVNVDYVLKEILGGKFSREQIVKEIPALGILPSNVNLYLNVGGSVINNSASISLNSVAVQGITIPDSYTKSDEAISTVTTELNSLLSKSNTNTGSVIDKLLIEDEEIKLAGKFPTSLTRTQK